MPCLFASLPGMCRDFVLSLCRPITAILMDAEAAMVFASSCCQQAILAPSGASKMRSTTSE